MTTPANPDPANVPPAWLAAYADGELDTAARAAVERWLTDHPEALDELHSQRALSPANVALWDRAEPPAPSAEAWAAVRRGIDAGLNPPAPVPAGSRWRVFAGLAAAGTVAAAVWVAVGLLAPKPAPVLAPVEVVKRQLPPVPDVAPIPRAAGPASAPAPRTVPDPLAGIDVLPMASDDDVVLDRVPHTGAGWLPVGRHPLPDSLVFATVEDVHLEGVDPSPAWPAGGPKMTTAPGDTPMLFAAKRR